jgi:hypothetical protein
MKHVTFHSESLLTRRFGRLTGALVASVVLASGAAYGACIDGLSGLPTDNSSSTEQDSKRPTFGQFAKHLAKSHSSIQRIDPDTGEKYTELRDAMGNLVGSIEENGVFYDAQSDLIVSECAGEHTRKSKTEWSRKPWKGVTVRFSKSETQSISANVYVAAGVGCSAVGFVSPAASFWCGTNVALLVWQANRALNQGQCLEVYVPYYTFVTPGGLSPSALTPRPGVCYSAGDAVEEE